MNRLRRHDAEADAGAHDGAPPARSWPRGGHWLEAKVANEEGHGPKSPRSQRNAIRRDVVSFTACRRCCY